MSIILVLSNGPILNYNNILVSDKLHYKLLLLDKIIKISFSFFFLVSLFNRRFQFLWTFLEKKRLDERRIADCSASSSNLPLPLTLLSLPFPFLHIFITLHSLVESGTLNRDSLCMTSASELFHTRRHRLGRNAIDLGFDTELQAADSFRRRHHVRRLRHHPVYSFSFCSCPIPQISYCNWKLKFLKICMHSTCWIVFTSGMLIWY